MPYVYSRQAGEWEGAGTLLSSKTHVQQVRDMCSQRSHAAAPRSRTAMSTRGVMQLPLHMQGVLATSPTMCKRKAAAVSVLLL